MQAKLQNLRDSLIILRDVLTNYDGILRPSNILTIPYLFLPTESIFVSILDIYLKCNRCDCVF